MSPAAAAARVIAPTDNIKPPLITADQLKVDFNHLEAAVAELETAATGMPPVIEDDEDLAAATTVATNIISQSKRCEDTRVEQTTPYVQANKVINDHFTRGLIARLTAAQKKIDGLTTPYLRKKALREQIARDEAAAAARRLVDEAAAQVTQAVKSGDVKAATAAVTKSNSLADFAAKTTSAAAAPTASMAKTTTAAGTASLVDNWTFDELDMNTVDLEVLRPFIPQAAIEQALRAFIKAGRRQVKGAHIFNDNKPRFRG